VAVAALGGGSAPVAGSGARVAGLDRRPGLSVPASASLRPQGAASVAGAGPRSGGADGVADLSRRLAGAGGRVPDALGPGPYAAPPLPQQAPQPARSGPAGYPPRPRAGSLPQARSLGAHPGG